MQSESYLLFVQSRTFSINGGLLKKFSHFEKLLSSQEANGELVLKDEKPDVFKHFKNWLYTGELTYHSLLPTPLLILTGEIEKPPVKISVQSMPTAFAIAALENDLLARFNNHQTTLILL